MDWTCGDLSDRYRTKGRLIWWKPNLFGRQKAHHDRWFILGKPGKFNPLFLNKHGHVSKHNPWAALNLIYNILPKKPQQNDFHNDIWKKSEEKSYFQLRFYCKNQQVLSPENCSSDNRMLQLILMYCRQRKWDFVFQVIWFTSYIEFFILL